ncbi:MAG: hypothetical protein J5716_04910 [Alphaproteobacteria bacterium]|nr:hypothetical protein [Alphaproteobacteria bacterium]
MTSSKTPASLLAKTEEPGTSLSEQDETKELCTIHGVQVRIKPSEKEKVETLLGALEAIPTGRTALKTLQEDKTTLSFDSALDTKGAYYPDKNEIVLNDALLNMDSMKFVLVHEARHRKQSSLGKDKCRQQRLDAASDLMIGRAIEADADVEALIACKEWEALGDKGPLEELAKGRKAMVEAYNKAHSLSDAFKAWYADELTVGKYERLYGILPYMSKMKRLDKNPYKWRVPLVSAEPKDIAPFCGADRVEGFEEFLNSDQARQVHAQTKTVFELYNLLREAKGLKPDTSIQGIPTRNLTNNPEAKTQADALIAQAFKDFNLNSDNETEGFRSHIADAFNAVKKINNACFKGSRDNEAEKELETAKKNFFAHITGKKEQKHTNTPLFHSFLAIKGKNSRHN